MRRKRKLWEVREDLRPLLREAKELFPTLLGHVRTKRVLLCSFMSRKSGHIARISRNRSPWALALPEYDYAIEFWEPRFKISKLAYQMFVVVHELFHIPQGGFDQNNPLQYRKLIKHDLEDFVFLRQMYGLQLESVDDVLKGELALLKKSKKTGPARFPRTLKIK